MQTIKTVRQSRLKDVRSKNFQGTEQELEQILAFLLRVNNARDQQQHAEIEITGSIREAKEEEGNELVISIRKRIDSITVSLFNTHVHIRQSTKSKYIFNAIHKAKILPLLSNELLQ